MGFEFRVEETVKAPPERVFAALTDVDGWRDWMPGLVRIDRNGSGPLVQGSVFRETRKMMGHQAVEEFQVTRVEPHRALGLFVDGSKGSSRKGEYHFLHELAPAGDATRLSLHGRIEVPGVMAKIFGRLMIGMFRKACAKDLSALARHVETGGKGTSAGAGRPAGAAP
ncbi:MAG TPA: SRPBCC family protein [Candidatus Polarisedimenticolia bacterium]|nr:SRPBCC family protein [Candidatus Polarisedimenticolia bacterium]